jgi:hypothetical protein
VKICFPKSKWCPKIKVKVNVVNLSDKVEILDLSLLEVGWCYGKNETRVALVEVKSMELNLVWGKQC